MSEIAPYRADNSAMLNFLFMPLCFSFFLRQPTSVVTCSSVLLFLFRFVEYDLVLQICIKYIIMIISGRVVLPRYCRHDVFIISNFKADSLPNDTTRKARVYANSFKLIQNVRICGRRQFYDFRRTLVL